ncbi:MAG: ATP-binding protein, partial [Alicyclobacillaceae bacterium]|nr:ATP-binding protein [Alicyclobacillaceae bacterium]
MVSNQNRRICTSLPNRLGTEKEAMALVESFLDGLGAGQARLDDLKTLVSEACLNAIEHGNGLDPAATYDV